jgi:hypothetical protein
MFRTHKRITGGLAVLALALATAAPADARFLDSAPNGSNVVVGASTQPSVNTPSHHSSGNGSDWGYVAAGGVAMSLVLIGIGGTAVGRRQRRTRSSAFAA